MNDFVFKIDHFVGKLFHNIYLWGGEFANNVMSFISYIAEAGILFLLLGLGLALFKRTRKIGITILFAVAIGFLLTNLILKNTIERNRPFENIGSDFYKWWLDAGATYESGYSFPSGHTTATTAFAIATFLTTNKRYNWPILFLPVLMACSRIYLMVHYFSDCLGGLIVGSIAAILAYIIVKLIYKSKLKLFVWVQQFNIFKPKQGPQMVISQSKQAQKETSSTENEESVEEFVYTTQNDEIPTFPTASDSLIKQKVEQSSKDNDNK